MDKVLLTEMADVLREVAEEADKIPAGTQVVLERHETADGRAFWEWATLPDRFYPGITKIMSYDIDFIVNALLPHAERQNAKEPAPEEAGSNK